MSELFVEKNDIQTYDRAVGIEAAYAINGIVNGLQKSYSEVQTLCDHDELPAHVGNFLLRAEETADRHIGRRAENDQLFAHTQLNNGARGLSILEVYSKTTVEGLMPQSEIERQTENRNQVQQQIADLTEPLVNALRDKLPVKLPKHRWWNKNNKNQTMLQTYDGQLHNDWKLTYTQEDEAPLLTQAECHSYPIIASLNISDNRVSRLSIDWSLSGGDLGGVDAVFQAKNSLLREKATALGVDTMWAGQIIIETGEEPSISVHNSSLQHSMRSGVRYAYDASKNLFIDTMGSHKPVTAETVSDIIVDALAFFPTVEIVQ